MRTLQLLSVFVIALNGLVSCNDAKYPLNMPSDKNDARLLGKWEGRGNSKRPTGRVDTAHLGMDEPQYFITAKSDAQYMIKMTEKKKNIVEEHLAWLSYIQNTRFLNVESRERDEVVYTFLRILDVNEKADSMTIASIADTAMKNMQSSAQVREYLTAHVYDPKFYDDTFFFVKVK